MSDKPRYQALYELGAKKIQVSREERRPVDKNISENTDIDAIAQRLCYGPMENRKKRLEKESLTLIEREEKIRAQGVSKASKEGVDTTRLYTQWNENRKRKNEEQLTSQVSKQATQCNWEATIDRLYNRNANKYAEAAAKLKETTENAVRVRGSFD